jgi:FixJ family two-component response regulator
MSQTRHTIFIIDDDESLCRALNRLLTAVDLNVVRFASAEDFLQFTGQPEPGWLILDVHLPGLSGLELQRRLNSEGRRFPVIFITANENEQVREQALRAGAIAFLRKPFDEQSLLDVMNRALAG